MKLRALTLASCLYLALLIGIHLIHTRFFNVDVVFYAAIGDAFLATAVAATILFAAAAFKALGSLEKTLLALLWLAIGYGAAISIPTVVDRSLSFYLLEKIQQRGGAVRFDKVRDIVIREYIPEHRLVDVRLTEQIESGTIVLDGQCVRLTDKGNRIAGISRAYRQHFLPKRRLLLGSYSDDLTDPFRHSPATADYTCK